MNQETNLEICKALTEFFSKPENKDLRFFQGLSTFNLFKQQFDDSLICTGIDDPFYYSNSKVLEKIK